MTEKKRNQLQNLIKIFLKIVILISSVCHFCVYRGYPLTQFQALKNSLAQRSIGNNFSESQISKNRNLFY